MTRSNARELAVHLIYELDYTKQPPLEALETRLQKQYYQLLSDENEVYTDRPSKKQRDYLTACVTGVCEKAPELDGIIEKYSVGWGLHRISRFAKAALRMALYEILYVEDVPTGVAINECVEIVKKYEDADTVKFVNGILGSFSRSLREQEQQ